MARNWSICLFVLLLLLPGQSTIYQSAQSPQYSSQVDDCDVIESLRFNGSQAFEDLVWQVELGPRLPGSEVSAQFRENLTVELEDLGFDVTTSEHEHLNYNFTNLYATFSPDDEEDVHPRVIISAHYDSRNIADRDENVSNHQLPIDGANDGASGAAVLMELARLIPTMNLTYPIQLFWNDAEDQDDNYTLGSKAWSENLTESEIESIDAFLLLDMIGDVNLTLHKIIPGNESLFQQFESIVRTLGYDGSSPCQTDFPNGILDVNRSTVVFDDHVHPLGLGIPSIDIMDPVYGEESESGFGTLWHTTNDTVEHVSAASLLAIGRIIEYGLEQDLFIDYIIESENVSQPIENTSNEKDSPPPKEIGWVGMPSHPMIFLLAFIWFNKRRQMYH